MCVCEKMSFICFRRTSVFSVLLGIVIGFCLTYCFIVMNYCVVIYIRDNQQYKTVINKNTHQHNSTTTTTTNEKLSSIKSINIECDDTPLYTSFKQRGDFWVLYNYIKAVKEFRCNESITYTTHGDYMVLDSLSDLVERWQGPISVAVYAPGNDFNATLESIAYLRYCKNDLIRIFVTFHLFFGYKDIPDVVSVFKLF